jgi:lipopolysaccharide biosynthesis regulator YciM
VNELSPWLFLLLVAVVAGLALVIVFRKRGRPEVGDGYTRGLELWLAGDRKGARAAFRAAIKRDPEAVDPYIQLGNLLRLTGDAKRAAVLHRSLTVRTDVPGSKRLSISLALAEDLVALQQWPEARRVLDALEPHVAAEPRYWRARFAQYLGAGDGEAAARALQRAGQLCSLDDAREFLRQHAIFQLDRALQACRRGQVPEARRLLKQVPREGPLRARRIYVEALTAARERDHERAVDIVAAGLLTAPDALAPYLPALQEILLESGQFDRTVPILESACQAEDAPPALWIALALLYEKLDEREKALHLLESKAGDVRLTPNAAAPFLKLLVAEAGDTSFARAWRILHLPAVERRWRCRECGTPQDKVRWFCPVCRSFDSHIPVPL